VITSYSLFSNVQVLCWAGYLGVTFCYGVIWCFLPGFCFVAYTLCTGIVYSFFVSHGGLFGRGVWNGIGQLGLS
jgi:hypothetical protein